MIQFDEDKQTRRYGDLLKKEEEELVQVLASKYNVEYVDLNTSPVSTDALQLISEPLARTAKAAAYSIVNKNLKVATRNPDDEKFKEIIAALKDKGYNVIISLASTSSLSKAWETYTDISASSETQAGSLSVSSDEITSIVEKTRSFEDIVTILHNTMALKKSFRVSKILETILAGALATNASDVHIEPEEAFVRLRFRLDGVLVDVINIDSETYSLLLSRIKLLSGLKINIKKDSQDGRFSVHISGSEIEIRTSILPGAYNESIVLRILNPKSISVPLEDLGIPKKLLGIILKEIDKPNGMILTTGPTGSGKTTTLYAFLRKSYNVGVKIITIEDPIEYHLQGIVQTQVNDKGYTFLDGLRAALRQDPDIIMVGEIRDGETASIAINSALTGHLVFSTLHTNGAAGAFPRLIDLGINPKILSSALNMSLAQRLLRKLCVNCKKEVSLDDPEQAKAKQIIESTLGTIYDKSEIPAQNGPRTMWVAVGCETCNHIGYKGRTGVYEGILVHDEAVDKVISTGGSDHEIAEAARHQGILTMKQDGIIKVLSGLTSLDELGRVIDLDE